MWDWFKHLSTHVFQLFLCGEFLQACAYSANDIRMFNLLCAVTVGFLFHCKGHLHFFYDSLSEFQYGFVEFVVKPWFWLQL